MGLRFETVTYEINYDLFIFLNSISVFFQYIQNILVNKLAAYIRQYFMMTRCNVTQLYLQYPRLQAAGVGKPIVYVRCDYCEKEYHEPD